MSFDLILGHIPGKANLAADYLSRMYVNPDTKFTLQLKDRLLIHDVEIDISSKQPDNALTHLTAGEHYPVASPMYASLAPHLAPYDPDSCTQLSTRYRPVTH